MDTSKTDCGRLTPGARATTATPRQVIQVGKVKIGGGNAVVIAGPCSIESKDQLFTTAEAVAKSGGAILRGGAFKPRTSPFDFQGLGYKGLELLREAGDKYNLPVITEVMSEFDIQAVAEIADIVQVGARNMQNFALLKRLGQIRKPILLKRGAAATVKEWLSAADYILAGGNDQVILCERGIRSFDNVLRNTLDLATVAFLKETTKFPVIVDPSHATGRRSIVPSCALASIAIGADGVMVEVHPEPEKALSDGPQSLTLSQFQKMMDSISKMRNVQLNFAIQSSAMAA